MGTHQHRGFTLIELLVVIAVIAILAAILFPVFAKAREKARQTACTNNQRQIVTATLMYTQDHDEVLPESAEFWGALGLDKGVLVCPTAGKKLSNGYIYSNWLSGKALGEVDDPTTYYVTADGQHTGGPAPASPGATPSFDNVAYSSADLATTRHAGKLIVAFLDGHVSMLKADASPEFDASRFLSNVPPPVVAKLSGTAQGGNANNSAFNAGGLPEAAFDGNLGTSPYSEEGNGTWVGLDFGSVKTIAVIKYAALNTSYGPGRLNGGKFQMSTTANYSSGVVDLYTVNGNGPVVLTSVTIEPAVTTRYIRFAFPNGAYATIGDIEVWGY